MPELTLKHFEEVPELLAAPVLSELRERAPQPLSQKIFVTEIDPAHKGGDDFCNFYNIPRENGANCVILEAKRNERSWYVAALVPVGCKMDIGGFVRRTVGARKLSVAQLDPVLDATRMEYGSITVVGLPPDWQVLVDESLVSKEYLFLGSGKVISKLRIPGAYFTQPERFTLVANLGISNQEPAG